MRHQDFPGLTTSVCNLRPPSRGEVTLQSADPRTPVLINPNYLDTEDDRKVAADSIRHARKIMSAPAFADYEPIEHFPGAEMTSDIDLAAASGKIATSIFHPVGTCKMGQASDPTSVVSPTLNVHGLRGLRVVDASIMPRLVYFVELTPS